MLEWGERLLPDYIGEFEDGEAEYLADYAFAELAELFRELEASNAEPANPAASSASAKGNC